MKANLILVEADGINSNKYYNMELVGSTIQVEYGRVNSTRTTCTYPASKWNSLLNSKLKKGYKDISFLKNDINIVVKESNNKDFNEFYNTFKKYTGDFVSKTYSINKATKSQLKEAQLILDNLSKITYIKEFNKNLLELFKILPRKMSDVKLFLLKDLNDKNRIILREQDSIDSMESINNINVSNPFDNLDIEFELSNIPIEVLNLFNQGNQSRFKIYKCYKIIDKTNIVDFDKWLFSQNDAHKNTQLLIHGTRNPNVFNILKSGLLIRPSNAATISGNAYGNEIYHSAHTSKSLNYTGYDNDKIFFIQRVNMGIPYEYSGWYRQGKDLDKSNMNYSYLKKNNYDSLYVKPGDGLLNSEYIVYNKQQTITNYILWLK